LKARDRDPARSLAACRELGAMEKGTLSQVDTYFAVPGGRLKLREERGAPARLVAYQRPDSGEARVSRFRLVEVADPAGMREALSEVLGIEVVVRKRRQLFLHQGVRIHLDEVAGLGRFVELEGVAGEEGDPAQFEEELARLQEALGIRSEDLIAGSYADLLLDSPQSGRGAAW
jgi:predicted adenylyl cyclase CyaB